MGRHTRKMPLMNDVSRLMLRGTISLRNSHSLILSLDSARRVVVIQMLLSKPQLPRVILTHGIWLAVRQEMLIIQHI